MDDETAFLRAIAEDPENETPRLVFADWLQERGDVRADWVRNEKVWRWMAPDASDPVPRLIEALKGDDQNSRRAAGQALPQVGAVAISALIDVIETNQSPASDEAGSCLGRFQIEDREPFLPRLFALVRDPQKQVGYPAAQAIKGAGELGRPYIAELRAGLRDRNHRIRMACVHALGNLGTTASEACDDVAERLHYDEHQNVRWVATGTIHSIASPETAIRFLCRALHDPQLSVAHVALYWLGDLGSSAKSAIPDILGTMVAETELRCIAAETLGKIGVRTPEVIETLHTCLDDEEPYIQQAARTALSELDPIVRSSEASAVEEGYSDE